MIPRVDTAPRGVETPPHELIADWLGLIKPRAARVAPGANAEVSPHPGRLSSDPRIRYPSMSLQLQHTGDENADLRVDTAPHGIETPTALAGC